MGDFQTIRRQLGQRLATPRHIPIERDRVPQAAVSLILSEARGSAQALIIKRAERPGDHWSGHLALPGGRAQDEDADLIATAARETYGEVGSAFWISIADLKREGRSSFFSMPQDGVINKWPAYPSEGGPIWGITEG